MNAAADLQTVLVAEDDCDDCLMLREALARVATRCDARFVGDGEELLRYLRREGPYRDPADAPRPRLILLDLNMPRMDGREVLECLRVDPELRTIPVVVLTTSDAATDRERCKDLGARGCVRKPESFSGLVETLGSLTRQWLLSPGDSGASRGGTIR